LRSLWIQSYPIEAMNTAVDIDAACTASAYQVLWRDPATNVDLPLCDYVSLSRTNPVKRNLRIPASNWNVSDSNDVVITIIVSVPRFTGNFNVGFTMHGFFELAREDNPHIL